MVAQKADASVVGLGAMGGAIARALISAGKRTAIWNRDPRKARELRAAGALWAPDASSALREAPLVILIVTDADAAEAVLDRAGDLACAERVLVFLGSATPQQAATLSARVSACGGQLLLGTIMAYPREIGLRDATILYSGPREAFDRHVATLEVLAGRSVYVGPSAVDAKMLSWPLYVQFFTAVSGFFEGAALARTMGMSAGSYARWVVDTLGPFYARHVVDLGRRLDEEDFGGDQATLDVEAHAANAMVDLLTVAGVDAPTTAAYQSHIQRALEAGYGRRSVAAAAALVGQRREQHPASTKHTIRTDNF
jgi:3-hydroxyisobutyrate dehydrogenase-like beta-hydroxyacid dehydrogenase